MVKIQRYMTVAGTTILLTLLGSTTVLRRLPYDTGVRGGARGAVAAAGFLMILWVAVALPIALMRWRITAAFYRAILTVNTAAAALLLWELLKNR